ncbi:MAG: M20 family metallopeptidase [Anaerolineae bacterium]|nr:M20 family metallopeptidase [Thermoflexales bacterium]MDW8396458.1 M20 family metallopeptidase [Anaerolineae bacterium]
MLTQREQHVLSLVDDDELIEWVQALTRIPSVWRPDEGIGEEAAARWVEARCREIGLHTWFETVTPGRPNVIAATTESPRQTTRPLLLFEGHTDVVTEGPVERWSDPPFSATIRDGRIYGRGANDMKAGLCCALAALKAIRRSGIRLSGDLMLAAVCDEEGEMLGIKHFIAQGWADRVSACVVCEPEENRVCIAQKGVMWVRAVVRGVMAHGAMPLTGVNAAYPLARFLCLTHALEEREIARHGSHALLGQPSITPTILLSPPRGEGEPQNNVMPEAAECVLDLRLIPGQDPGWLSRQLEQMLAACVATDPRLRYEFHVLEVRPPTHTDRAHPLVQALAGAYADLTGQPPIYGGVPGSTDGTILNAQKGIPIVTCGPGDTHIPHHIDEWVSIDEIKLSARLYVLAALRFLGGTDD